ncbi:hypothetical protein FACS1894125_2930 [Actinomycetota bacterium]|nr:hypothetical protein FACS1894125_2930 [Actinomycetota bacterium]
MEKLIKQVSSNDLKLVSNCLSPELYLLAPPEIKQLFVQAILAGQIRFPNFLSVYERSSLNDLYLKILVDQEGVNHSDFQEPPLGQSNVIEYDDLFDASNLDKLRKIELKLRQCDIWEEIIFDKNFWGDKLGEFFLFLVSAINQCKVDIDILRKEKLFNTYTYVAQRIDNPKILEKLSHDSEIIRQSIAVNYRSSKKVLLALAKDSKESVRSTLAYRKYLPKDVLAVLSRDKYDGTLVGIARNENTPAECLSNLATNSNYEIALHVAANKNTPSSALMKLASSKDELIRASVASNLNVPTCRIEDLLKDKSEIVRAALATNESIPQYIIKILSEDENSCVRSWVSTNCNTPLKTLDILSNDKSVQEAIIFNDNAPSHLLAKLADSKDVYVREKVAQHINTPIESLINLANEPIEDITLSVFYNPSTPIEVILKLIFGTKVLSEFHIAKKFNVSIDELNSIMHNSLYDIKKWQKRRIYPKDCRCRENLQSMLGSYIFKRQNCEDSFETATVENIAQFLMAPLVPNGRKFEGISEENTDVNPNYHNVKPFDELDDADRRNISLWLYCELWGDTLLPVSQNDDCCFWDHHKNTSVSYYSGDTLSVKNCYGVLSDTCEHLNNMYWREFSRIELPNTIEAKIPDETIINVDDPFFIENLIDYSQDILKDEKVSKELQYELWKNSHCLANFFPIPRNLNTWRGYSNPYEWYDSTTKYLKWIEDNWDKLSIKHQILDNDGNDLSEFNKEYFGKFDSFNDYIKTNFFTPLMGKNLNGGDIDNDFSDYNSILEERATLMAKELYDRWNFDNEGSL